MTFLTLRTQKLFDNYEKIRNETKTLERKAWIKYLGEIYREKREPKRIKDIRDYSRRQRTDRSIRIRCRTSLVKEQEEPLTPNELPQNGGPSLQKELTKLFRKVLEQDLILNE